MSEQTAGEVGARIRRARGRMGVERASQRAEISPSTWRNVERGWQYVAGGKVPYTTTPETLAAMARAVGLDPGELLRLAGFSEDDIEVDDTPVEDLSQIENDLVLLITTWAGQSPDRQAVVERARRALRESSAGRRGHA